LGEVVSWAEHGQARTVLTRHGKPVAVVISIEDLREWEAADDEADLAAAREALAQPERVAHRDVLAEFGIETLELCTTRSNGRLARCASCARWSSRSPAVSFAR
jgi:prevent-host-death family protein